jgi:hypothetical protein
MWNLKNETMHHVIGSALVLVDCFRLFSFFGVIDSIEVSQPNPGYTQPQIEL